MSQPSPDPEPRVLGQLLAAYSTFSIFPDKQRMGEFVQRAVEGVPGISACGVCIRGGRRPRLGTAEIPECETCATYQTEMGQEANNQCPLSNRTDLRVLPLQTQDTHYGFFLINLDKPAAFTPYEPFINNLANSLAVNIERRWQKEQLQTANDELLKLRDHLQDLVGKRTVELEIANNRLQHLNAVLRTIRNVNQIIVREGDLERLVQTTCESLVETRCYLNAWIALADSDSSGALIPKGMAGTDEAYIGTVRQLGRANELKCIAAALGRPGVFVIEDPRATCSSCPLSQTKALRRSAIAIRLEHRGRVFGVLVVSTDPEHAGDAEEHALLVEVADDLGLALHNLDQESARKQAEAVLRVKDWAIESSINAIAISDLKGRLTYVNRAFFRLWGYRDGREVLGRPATDFWQSAEDPAKVIEVLQSQGFWQGEMIARRQDGSSFDVGLAASVVVDGDGEPLCMMAAFEDITERKRSETALRLKDFVFHASIAANSIADTKGVITEANAAFLRAWAYERNDDVVGRPITEFLQNEAEAVAIVTALNTTGEWVGEYTAKRKDGSTFLAMGLATVLRGNANEMLGYYSAVSDITDRTRAEADLRDSLDLLRIAQVAARAGVWDWDMRSGKLTWSPEFFQLFGIDPSAGASFDAWRAAVHPEDRGPAEARIEQAVQQRTPLTSEYRVVLPGGTTRWMFAAGNTTYDDSGKPLRMTGVCIDITERKRIEAELKESQGRYQSLFQASQDGLALADADTAMIVDCNPALLRMVGRTREEVVGQHQKVLHPQQDGEVEESFRVHREQKPELAVETQLATKTGSLVDVEIRAGEVVLGGRRHLVGSFRDITERRRAEAERQKLEEQLRASQKIEAIGSLAGGVAHDFNNILSVILSYTGFAMEALREGDPLREDLVEVKKAGERAVALTRQLLAFSRKQILQPVPLSLNQIAAGVEKMLRRIVGEDIDYVQVLAADIGVVQADPGQLEQVLMNLVVNARDAMPEGGKLTIETSNVEVDEEYAARHVAVTPGSYVQLAVTDTGCGMDEQTKARLFEPFFTTKEKGKGTGLGLSTVYGIVKQSGGNIWVYSEPGQGTTFKIYLPRELGATATVTRAPGVVARATGTETVLVVEDEEALRKVARRSLEAAGFTVLTAADGVEALETAARHAGEIHLLLTDVVMPRMSGRALAQALVKTRPAIKVVYMSGYTDNAIVHHGVLDAGTQFIGKPFTGADLTRKVREVLDGGAASPAAGPARAGEADADLEEQPLDPAALRALPADVLLRLRKAVVAARYGEIVELVESIRSTAPEVAARLRRMADLFDYDGLRGLLDGREEVARGK